MKEKPKSKDYNLPYEESEYRTACSKWMEEAENKIAELKEKLICKGVIHHVCKHFSQNVGCEECEVFEFENKH